jgi:putative membrane protein
MRRPDWQQQGQEPDYRFTFANERTFLAWIRTALAVLAGSVLLDQFASHEGSHGLLLILARALSLVAALLAANAYLQWKRNEIAMRNAAPLPPGMGVPLLSLAAIAAALVLGALILFR